MANKRAAAESRRIFVLDANVLIDDPAALFRFDEHDVHLPMVVLEELDARKKGVSEGARNGRPRRFMGGPDAHAGANSTQGEPASRSLYESSVGSG